MVVPFAGQQHADRYAACRGTQQRVAKAPVREKIRRAALDRLPRARHQDLEQDARLRGAPRRRRAVDHHAEARAGRHDSRLANVGEQKILLRKDLARGFEPVLGERSLQTFHQFAGNAEHGVAPRRVVGGGPDPVVRDAGTADESHFGVDHEDVAVGAIVEALERVPGDRLIPVDLAAGRAQRGKIPVRRRQAADAVDDQAHRNARPRALDQGGEDLAALIERARAGVTVRLVVDRIGSLATPNRYSSALRAAGGKVYWYQPIAWYALKRFNNRTPR